MPGRFTDGKRLAITVILFLIALTIKARQPAGTFFSRADTLSLYSRVLNETRVVYIHVPKPDSSGRVKKYPVLYLMDGESHFEMLSQYSDYLSRWDVNVIPPTIIVGIINTKRTRDLTPTESIINYFGKPDTSAVSWMKPSGGNALFLKFIREELMPYVEAAYPTAPFKIFAGHSFGGLAAVNCMLTQPEMFDAYIAISPSFWWDKEYVIKLAEKKLDSAVTPGIKIFYSDAGEGDTDKSTFHENLLKFNALVTRKKVSGLVYKYQYYPHETHMTEPMPAYYDALRFIYKDWRLPTNQ